MKMKKGVFLFAILVAAALVACSTFIHRKHVARLEQVSDAFGRIAAGMNRADAEAIIGRQPDYTGVYEVAENRIDETWEIEGNRLNLRNCA